MSYEIEKPVWQPVELKGYTLKAWYLQPPNDADCAVEVSKDGKAKHFLFPAYKIWNIAAHFPDIVEGEIAGDSRGYNMAAWNGISGAVFLLPQPESV